MKNFHNKLGKILTKVLSARASLIVLSVIIALILWYAGYINSNPVETKEYYLPLRLSNESRLQASDKFLKNKDALNQKTVKVNVRAPRKLHQSFGSDCSSGEVYAYIDFAVSSLLYAEAMYVVTDVQIQMPSKYTDENLYLDVIRKNPVTVEVQYDTIDKRVLPLSANILGDLPEAFSATTPSCNPKQVTIIGPSAELDKITSVEVSIDAPKNADEAGSPNNFSQVGKIEAKDNNGAVVSLDNIVFKNPSGTVVTSANVSYSIVKAKEISVNPPQLTGEPADGFMLLAGENYTSISTIWIKGAKEAVDAAEYIQLDPVDISGRTDETEPIIIQLEPYLSNIDSRLEFVTPNESKVQISPVIEPVTTKSFDYYAARVELNPIALFDSSTMIVSNGTLNKQITVSGPKSLMDNFDVYRNVKISADISSIVEATPGEYSLPIKISATDGCSIVSAPDSMTITVIDPSNLTPTEIPTETESPDSTPVPEDGGEIIIGAQ